MMMFYVSLYLIPISHHTMVMVIVPIQSPRTVLVPI